MINPDFDSVTDKEDSSLKIRTALKAGKTAETSNPLETVYFALLDVLQKPTDWLYNLLQPGASNSSKAVAETKQKTE